MTCGFMNSAEVAAKELWERAVLVCGLGRAELVRSAVSVGCYLGGAPLEPFGTQMNQVCGS